MDGVKQVIDTCVFPFVRAHHTEELFSEWLRLQGQPIILLSPVETQIRRAGLGVELDHWILSNLIDQVKVRLNDQCDRAAKRLQGSRSRAGMVKGNIVDLRVVAWAEVNRARVITAEKGIEKLCGELGVACWDMMDLYLNFIQRGLLIEDSRDIIGKIEREWSKPGSSAGQPSDWAGSFSETRCRRQQRTESRIDGGVS